MTEFYLIRHGQTNANAAGLKQGTINSEITYLNDTGKKQIQTLADNFDISFADRLIHSPLRRTEQSAKILNQKANLPISSDNRLLEISYGQWDGQQNSELRRNYPQYFDKYLNDVLPTYVEVASQGETFQSVIDRISDFLQETAKKYPDQKIIIVTHGFTVKAAALSVLKPKDLMTLPEPDNASVTKIVINNKEYLPYYNRHFGF